MRELSAGEKWAPEFLNSKRLSIALDGQLYPVHAQQGVQPVSFPVGLHFSAHRKPDASGKLQIPVEFTEVTLRGMRFHESCLISIGGKWYLANPGDLLLARKINLQSDKACDLASFYLPLSFWRAEAYLVRTNQEFGTACTFSAGEMSHHAPISRSVHWQEQKVSKEWPQDRHAKAHLLDLQDASNRKIACCFINEFRAAEQKRKGFDASGSVRNAWENSISLGAFKSHQTITKNDMAEIVQIGLSGIVLYLKARIPVLDCCSNLKNLEADQALLVESWVYGAKRWFEKNHGACHTAEPETKLAFIDKVSRGNPLLRQLLGQKLELAMPAEPQPETAQKLWSFRRLLTCLPH